MDYAGDITAEHAWQILSEDPRAVLIDVRTQGEWDSVGIPAVPDASPDALFVEWVDGNGHANPEFVATVTAACGDTDAPLLFLCRSGRRSIGAATALTNAGYGSSYNILAGFEAPGGWRDCELAEG